MLVWALQMIIITVFILLSVAFFTLLERKFLSYSQTRVGPNKVVMGGVLQPVLDGGKLLMKEGLSPSQSSGFLFLALPGLFFLFMILIWSLSPSLFCLTSLGSSGLGLMIVLGLSVYSTLLVGVSSFSKFGAIGGIRAASQSVSYEITLSLIFFWGFLLWGGYSLGFSLLGAWAPLSALFLFCLVADVNRAPFDFAEGESELISGFNIEYGSLPFTLVFLGEYGMILGLSFILCSFFSENSVVWGTSFSCLIIFLRSALPRFRYDVLMGASWFFILPLSVGVLFLSLLFWALIELSSSDTARVFLGFILFFTYGAMWAWGAEALWGGSSEKLILILIILSILFLGAPVSGQMKKIFLMVCFMSVVFFSSQTLILFYVAFESTILPVALMILFWGSQPERVSALFYMVLYSVVSAFPLLFSLLLCPGAFLGSKMFFSGFLLGSLSLTFLVKMPLFGLHLWLPKAHVEAPSLGSIVLAGLLLKLGAWGLLVLAGGLWVYGGGLWLISSLGMVGGALLSTMQSDSKSLVAYSSVCHMNFMVLIFVFMPPLMKGGSVLMMLAHGVTSSFMFWITGLMFYLNYSRQLVFVGGVFSLSSALGILTTVLFFTNFGVPPSSTFFQESSFLSFLSGTFFPSSVLLMGYLLIVCYYSLFYLNIFYLESSGDKSSSPLMEVLSLGSAIYCFNLVYVILLL